MNKNKKTKKIITLVLGAVIVLTAGFGLGMALNPNDQDLISKETAIEIALEHAGIPQGIAMNIEARLTVDDFKRIYDVEFTANGFEFWYEIVARTGEIHDFGREGDGFITNNQPAVENPAPHIENPINRPVTPAPPSVLPAGAIDQEMAIAIALAHAGYTLQDVTSVNVVEDTEDGVPIFDVEFIANDVEYWYEIYQENGSIHDFLGRRIMR